MRHRWERDVDVRVVDCHDRACVACRHNAKRKQVLKLRRGIATGDTVHVCTVPEWGRKVWAALPGTYARVKQTSAGLRVGELVISLGGPPQGLDSEPMTGADALALAEANVAAYAEAGRVVSTSQDWPRDDEPDSATGCWRVIGERSRCRVVVSRSAPPWSTAWTPGTGRSLAVRRSRCWCAGWPA
jgi:hypothetical protein